jgi:hypothetical protein
MSGWTVVMKWVMNTRSQRVELNIETGTHEMRCRLPVPVEGDADEEIGRQVQRVNAGKPVVRSRKGLKHAAAVEAAQRSQLVAANIQMHEVRVMLQACMIMTTQCVY